MTAITTAAHVCILLVSCQICADLNLNLQKGVISPVLYTRAEQGAYIICEHHVDCKLYLATCFESFIKRAYRESFMEIVKYPPLNTSAQPRMGTHMHSRNVCLLYIIFMQKAIMTGRSLHLM